jgi:hypothetical protein
MRKVTIYENKIDWNVWKGWWLQRISDDTRDEPELAATMLYIPHFYMDIQIIRVFLEIPPE